MRTAGDSDLWPAFLFSIKAIAVHEDPAFKVAGWVAKLDPTCMPGRRIVMIRFTACWECLN
jgi:hypothetical protein